MISLLNKYQQVPITKKASEPLVSVYNNRLTFNPAVCLMIENVYHYEWVNIKQGIQNNQIVKLGLEFSSQEKPNSLRIRQKVFRGKRVEGLNLYSKALVERFFRQEVDSKVRKFVVEKVDSKTIAIDLYKERQ